MPLRRDETVVRSLKDIRSWVEHAPSEHMRGRARF